MKIVIPLLLLLYTSCSTSQSLFNELSKSERSEGFELLFNGQDLNNWTGNKDSYKVDNQNILVDPQGGGSGGNLYTALQSLYFNNQKQGAL